MPVVVTFYAIGVWCCVGLFTGGGWALGTWLIGKLCSKL
jgi:hypothetical protein